MTLESIRGWLRAAFVASVGVIVIACVVDEQFDDGQFLCDPKGGSDECPDGLSCGVDGVCRHHTAKPDGGGGTGGSPDGCFPMSCDKLAPKCGKLDDGCGSKIDCGCASPYTCGGAGKIGECGCLHDRSDTRTPGAAFEVVAGNTTWQNVSDALVSDDAWATTTAAVAAGKSTNTLKASACGFVLPAGAIVTGVQVTIERSATLGTIHDQEVRLLVKGNPLPTNAAKATDWGTTDAKIAYGGNGDLWGATSISASEVEAADFGVAISVAASTADTPRIDSIGLTVFFEDPACPK
jgi:hypothetical protein